MDSDEAPSESISQTSVDISGSTIGRLVTIGQINADHVTIQQQRGQHLPIDPALLVPPSSSRALPPSFLLRSRFGLTPFVDHHDLLGLLVAWATSPEAPLVMIVNGRGGTGKTRLAVELARQLSDEGWLAGVLSPHADASSLRALATAELNRLIIVDYAEGRPELSVHLIRELTSGTSPGFAKVLLLVRAPYTDPRAPFQGTTDGHDLVDLALSEAGTLDLGSLPLAAGTRDEIYKSTVQYLSETLGNTVAPSGMSLADLSSSDYERPLFLMIRALLDTVDEAFVPEDPLTLVQSFLAHERRYWTSVSSGADLRIDDIAFLRAAALATMVGADTEDALVELLVHVPDFSSADVERRHSVARILHDIYPGQDLPGYHYVGPIEPDLVAEAVIDASESSGSSTAQRAIASLNGPELQRCLATLARLLRDAPVDSEVGNFRSGYVGLALEPRVADLVGSAISAAATAEELEAFYQDRAFAPVLAQVIDKVSLSRDSLLASMRHLPQRDNIILRALCVALQGQFVGHARQIVEEHSDQLPSLASFLNTHSAWLAELGPSTTAATLVSESVDIYRSLFQVDPTRYRDDLAGVLANLSNRYSELGRHTEALAAADEAVRLYEEQGPATSRTRRYAIALNSLSNRLTNVGRTSEALGTIERAVVVARAAVDSGEAEATDSLALICTNLSCRLRDVGRLGEALQPVQEAVTLYRHLAEVSPAAHLPDLARSLSELARVLGALARTDEAVLAIQEAVALARRLAASGERRFLRQLAALLLIYAEQLELKEAARSVAEEEHMPAELVSPDAASSASTGAEVQRLPGEVYSEALRLFDSLSERGFEGDQLSEVQALRQFAVYLEKARRPIPAMLVAETSVGRARTLASTQSLDSLFVLANCLDSLSIALGQAGLADEAIVVADEGVEILRRLVDGGMKHHRWTLAIALHNYALALHQAGDEFAALEVNRRSVGLYRLMNETEGDYRCSLAESLATLACRLRALGHLDEALDTADEALRLADEVLPQDSTRALQVRAMLEQQADKHHGSDDS